MEIMTCVWKEDADGNYHADCGGSFIFNDDGPLENNFMWCPYCGEELHEEKYLSEVDK